jgi:hypothetical protein
MGDCFDFVIEAAWHHSLRFTPQGGGYSTSAGK